MESEVLGLSIPLICGEVSERDKFDDVWKYACNVQQMLVDRPSWIRA